MGEMADYYLENCFEDSEERSEDTTQPVVCKYCGASGLVWKQNNGKWRLYIPSSKYPLEVHSCKENYNE